MTIHHKSPTRVDFAGGTLDCWPLHLMVGDSVTVNLSISIWTEALLEPRADASIEILMRDLNVARRFSNLTEFLSSAEPSLRLLQKHVEYWKPKTGFYLETHSQSPLGGGLGGSSSLTISLIKAFSEWQKCKLDVNQAVTLAHNLEAEVLRKPTGTQDYFPALQSGLNAIHYTARGPELETIKTHPDFWNSRLSLVYTGQPHQSGLNNWQVIKAVMDGDHATLAALSDIKTVAWDLYRAVKADNWEALPTLFEREFQARIRLSKAFSSPEIERLHEVALNSGALAVKICGAGGGGCVLVWSSPENKEKVEAGCRKSGFEVLNVKAVV